ncbi:C-terminal helicase domain-containing protein, partial [Chamaesiphon sp. VAR_48_metabat_135_sub]|uniref:C-terminal helicase domain-containing protein n=1 Tax=Chamaesiphon sp. VAR_48_metabat_135_sub TaxID=2964699 RepID=UPI00286A24DE
AESSMYALGRTIINFRRRIEQMQDRLNNCTPDPEGLREFLFEHYKFSSTGSSKSNKSSDQLELWDREDEEDDDDELEAEPKIEKRQKLKTSIEQATDGLDIAAANRIHQLLLDYCDSDLAHLVEIQKLLTTEFIKDHKREQVTQKVRELTAQGHKVLLISTFSDTVIDYFSYMAKDRDIADAGIGLAIGSIKQYYSDDKVTTFTQHHACKGDRCSSNLKRKELFRLFAPIATCKNPVDRPQPDREIAVLIGSETLSIGQNLQDANYLINIDLPWNPMMLEQRIGRIDRPKHQPTANIYIYYANSESQLLRQATRLNNLNQKLVGDLAQPSEDIRELASMSNLGASVYGDTRFDDTILPGYVEFIHSLVTARSLEQESLQEQAARKRDTAQNLYTQQELLYASDIQKLITRLGTDYQANPISIGHQTGSSEPSGLLALTLKYFGPNGESIPDLQRQIFWNDLTSDRDGFGNAIAMAIRTTEFHQTTSTHQTLACMIAIYQELINFKQSLVTDLKISNLNDTFGRQCQRVNISSDRLNKINSRIQKLESLPQGLTRQHIKQALRLLNDWKQNKEVQQILRDYTEGDKSQLSIEEYTTNLVYDTMNQGLIPKAEIQAVDLSLSLDAMLLRVIF